MLQPQALSGYDLMARSPEPVDPGSRDFYGPKRFFPIVPDHRVYLEALGHGDDARFAGIFRDAWLKIPEADRRLMTDYWRSLERIPGILGISIKMENESGMRAREEPGVCEGQGMALRFCSPVLDRMPPPHVAALVAHELAHVLQSCGGPVGATARPEWITDELVAEIAEGDNISVELAEGKLRHLTDPVEHDADRTAVRWGFDVEAMKRWVKKNINFDDLPPPRY